MHRGRREDRFDNGLDFRGRRVIVTRHMNYFSARRGGTFGFATGEDLSTSTFDLATGEDLSASTLGFATGEDLSAGTFGFATGEDLSAGGLFERF
jgi:hypothetical protein